MTEANRPDSQLISALAGGEIEAGEAAAVRAAIDVDDDLREDYESLLATASLLAGAPAIRAPRRYAAALPPVQISNWWTRFTPTLLATAAVALIAFALVDLQGSRVGTPDRVRAQSRVAVSAAAPAVAAAPLAGAREIETEADPVIEPAIEVAAAPPAPVAEVRAVEAEVEVVAVAEAEPAPAAAAAVAEAPVVEAATAVEEPVVEAAPAAAEAPLAAEAPAAAEPEVALAEAATDLQTATADDGAAESAEPLEEPADETTGEEAGLAKRAPEPAVAAVAEAIESAPAIPPPTAPRAPPSPAITSLDQLLDPRWFAALVLGGLLLVAAGFAQTFRRP